MMEEEKKVPRHCALCFVSIPPEAVKCCGKCHKRAYCSRECQAKDWTLKGDGQGHKNWCGLECGEEDIDWEVVPIEGKGLGIIAKRFFPVLSRIMVDSYSSFSYKEHSNLEDLGQSGGKMARSSRGNHSCNPNANKFPVIDKGLKSMVVYAQKDIQPGEEICFNYLYFNETNCQTRHLIGERTFEDRRGMLMSKWGIICPPDCFCRQEGLEELVYKSQLADASILERDKDKNELDKADPIMDAEIDLHIVKMLLENHKQIRASLPDKANLLFVRFAVGIKRKSTMELAKEAIEEVCKIFSAVLHPESKFYLEKENWRKDPTTHPNYLKLENDS